MMIMIFILFFALLGMFKLIIYQGAVPYALFLLKIRLWRIFPPIGGKGFCLTKTYLANRWRDYF